MVHVGDILNNSICPLNLIMDGHNLKKILFGDLYLI